MCQFSSAHDYGQNRSSAYEQGPAICFGGLLREISITSGMSCFDHACGQ